MSDQNQEPGRDEAVQQMAAAIVDGYRSHQIVKKIVATFSVSERTAYRWLGLAREELAKEAAEGGESSLGLAVAIRRRNDLYRTSQANGDVRACLAVEQDRCRLLGLYAPERQILEHRQPAKPADEMTDDELAAVAGRGRREVDCSSRGTDQSDEIHPVHDAELPRELAPQGDVQEAGRPGCGEDQAADGLHAAAGG